MTKLEMTEAKIKSAQEMAKVLKNVLKAFNDGKLHYDLKDLTKGFLLIASINAALIRAEIARIHDSHVK